MQKFTSIHDVQDVQSLVKKALDLKYSKGNYAQVGKNKTLGLIFLNPSLRTRMSTQKAGMNIGMNVMTMDANKESWSLEFDVNAIMNGDKVENIKEAAAVMGQYCDIIGLRSFPELKDRQKDYQEEILNKFIAYSGVPVISLESATRHPLQGFADLLTIQELKTKARPKVVLAWAPHIKALPQAVPNSFAEWMNAGDVDFTIANPTGYDLDSSFTRNAPILHDLDEAIEGADFVYVKNWSSFENYGEVIPVEKDWMLNLERLKITNSAKIMHCLPVRRGVELGADILDSDSSVVIHQAGNRLWAAQAVLESILQQEKVGNDETVSAAI
jgi:N-succinyl-L-ornithine transcarbamylase